MIVKTGSYPNFKLLNTGRVVNRGYEFSANLLWKSFLLNTSASYGFYGKKIAGIPAGKITAGADYTYKSFTLSFTLEHITELFGQDSQSSPLVRLPNFTLIGAKLSYEFPKYVKVSLSADNVINKTYEIIKNYPMPGRTYYAGVTFKL
jgi:outer membrane receptor protein involved in Fe transport